MCSMLVNKEKRISFLAYANYRTILIPILAYVKNKMIASIRNNWHFDESIATVAKGWRAVKIGSQIGWVSGEYSEIISE